MLFYWLVYYQKRESHVCLFDINIRYGEVSTHLEFILYSIIVLKIDIFF